jgi:hypothetical protein
MIAVLIYVVDAVRRMLRKLVRGARILADSFTEAQKLRRAIPRVYMEE